jgi:hypothetical protein
MAVQIRQRVPEILSKTFKIFSFPSPPMPTTRANAAAAGACLLPPTPPRRAKWPGKEQRRRFAVAKGIVHFVPAKARGNCLSFPPDFDTAAVFPHISPSVHQGPVKLLHCGVCHKLWHCLEVFPSVQGDAQDNVTWGWSPGVFRTRACYFFHQNNSSLDGFEDSAREDKCFRTIQADVRGVIYLEPQ